MFFGCFLLLFTFYLQYLPYMTETKTRHEAQQIGLSTKALQTQTELNFFVFGSIRVEIVSVSDFRADCGGLTATA